MKKLLTVFLVTVALLGTGFAEAADIPDEQVVPGSISINGDRASQYGVFFEESIDTLRMPSLLYGYNPGGNFMDAVSFCTSLDDPACATASNFKYYSLFPPCVDDSDVDCIESVFAVTPDSPVKIQGVYTRTMPKNVALPYKGDSSRGLPQGGNAGIWTIPGIKHKGGSENYAVILSRVGEFPRNVTSTRGDFRAAILPVNLISNPGYKANIAVMNDQGTPGHKHVGINHVGTENFEPCAIVEDGACALRQSFPDGIQFGMSVKFSRSVNGWLHGRISSPLIDYRMTSYGARVEMQGFATKVPIVGGYVSSAQLNSEIESKSIGLPNPGGMIFPGSSGEGAMKSLEIWGKLFSDKAIASPTQWIFYNLPDWQMQGADKCILSSPTLGGFVTTNSTTYAAGPPVFNKATQSLDYKVASPHYLKNGSVFQGEYNLYIDSKVARCIYQFSSAPISATISIVNESGEAKVATTTVKESGGWIHLSAVGFTFSSPTVKVSLTQASSQEVKPTPVAVPLASKSSTITCVKGKSSKRITGIQPVCPFGWKKK